MAAVMVALATAAILSGCAIRQPATSADGLCPRGRVDNYMAARWQQCWYATQQGRWRIRNHEFHYDTIVFETEASAMALAQEIATRLVDRHRERFSEFLVYVTPAGAPAPTRRIRWTERGGFTTLELTSS